MLTALSETESCCVSPLVSFRYRFLLSPFSLKLWHTNTHHDPHLDIHHSLWHNIHHQVSSRRCRSLICKAAVGCVYRLNGRGSIPGKGNQFFYADLPLGSPSLLCSGCQRFSPWAKAAGEWSWPHLHLVLWSCVVQLYLHTSERLYCMDLSCVMKWSTCGFSRRPQLHGVISFIEFQYKLNYRIIGKHYFPNCQMPDPSQSIPRAPPPPPKASCPQSYYNTQSLIHILTWHVSV
jgi:hypothetical protein